MLCERCKKNEAVVYYSENVNGNKKAFALCEKCAAEAEKNGEINKPDFGKSLFGDSVNNLNSLFGSLFGIPQYQKRELGERKKCSLCGSAFDDIVNEGKPGCPECYHTFGDELSRTISKIHGAATHTGNAPERFRAGRERKRKIEKVEAELKAAVAAEEYERAAELRDCLKMLREEKSGD